MTATALTLSRTDGSLILAANKNSQNTHQDGPTLKAAETYVFLTSTSLGTVQLGNTTGAAYDAYTLNVNPAVMGGEAAGRTSGDFFLRQVSGVSEPS